MRGGKVFLSVISPVYNDAEALSRFLPSLFSVIQHYKGFQEVILIDDGSQDNVEAVYASHCNQLPKNCALRLVKLSRNFGKEAALSAGLTLAKGEAVLFIDSDGQHPPSLIDEMVQFYRDGAEMIASVQENRAQEKPVLRWFKRVFYRLMQDKQRYTIRPNAGDFRLMSRKVVDALLALPERQRFMKGLYAWIGFKTVYLSFQAQQRKSGKSKFNFANLFELAIVGITSFSQKPLRWISRMGLLVSLCALCYGLYIVIEMLIFGIKLPGWATLSAGIMFSAGVQLICLGVIGEYIGRIYEEVKQRPLFVIDQILDTNASEKTSNDSH